MTRARSLLGLGLAFSLLYALSIWIGFFRERNLSSSSTAEMEFPFIVFGNRSHGDSSSLDLDGDFFSVYVSRVCFPLLGLVLFLSQILLLKDDKNSDKLPLLVFSLGTLGSLGVSLFGIISNEICNSLSFAIITLTIFLQTFVQGRTTTPLILLFLVSLLTKLRFISPVSTSSIGEDGATGMVGFILAQLDLLVILLWNFFALDSSSVLRLRVLENNDDETSGSVLLRFKNILWILWTGGAVTFGVCVALFYTQGRGVDGETFPFISEALASTVSSSWGVTILSTLMALLHYGLYLVENRADEESSRWNCCSCLRGISRKIYLSVSLISFLAFCGLGVFIKKDDGSEIVSFLHDLSATVFFFGYNAYMVSRKGLHSSCSPMRLVVYLSCALTTLCFTFLGKELVKVIVVGGLSNKSVPLLQVMEFVDLALVFVYMMWETLVLHRSKILNTVIVVSSAHHRSGSHDYQQTDKRGKPILNMQGMNVL